MIPLSVFITWATCFVAFIVVFIYSDMSLLPTILTVVGVTLITLIATSGK